MHLPLLFVVTSGALVSAHLAVWHKGMYCLNGTTGTVNLNANEATTPLYMLPKSEWWFHHVNGCDERPPAQGDFLELPAGKDFTVEITANRAVTSLSYDGRYATEWADGATYPDNYSKSPGCITTPNMHTQNETMAAGTAFAISYQSDIKKVTAENLAVFTVRYHSPWKRLTTYSVPKALPACPEDGCICAWGWVPNGCGEPNIYHQALKCKVTGATATAPVAVAQPPTWCEDDQSKCTKGAKQMIYWHQKDGNNIEVSGNDRSGMPKSPAYNSKCGFPDGAQNDIFAPPSQGGGNGGSGSPAPAPNSATSASSSSAISSSTTAKSVPSASQTSSLPPPPATATTSSNSSPKPTSTSASVPSSAASTSLPETTSSLPKPTSSPSTGGGTSASSSAASNSPPKTTSSPPQSTSSPSTGETSGECPAKKHRKRSSTSVKKRSAKKHRSAAKHRRRRVTSF